ncbi:8727_t:CDS:2 [Funneliformis mosseae]|uniref:8727_t:CDS:1 n=1 Tax=Funneliformis mosseae TaxID=27381 RepID=A0A9N9BZF3_FUNMO|nr:8727_t:CDS:2 [Funneliformis mosseae]
MGLSVELDIKPEISAPVDDDQNNELTQSTISYPKIERLKEEVKHWQAQVHFWQNRHDDFLNQVEQNRSGSSSTDISTTSKNKSIEAENEAARTEMKEILKTLSSLYEMRYDKVFNSPENKKIQQKLVPELLRSLRPCYNPSYNKLKEWLCALHKHRRDGYLLNKKETQGQTS